jgi:hypothetical protein
MTKLDDRLAALATMSPAQLRAEWQDTMEQGAPAWAPDLLRRLLAYKLQEKRFGGLPASASKFLARMGTGEKHAAQPQPIAVRPGTRLVREWQGRSISVEVVEDGFLWEGQRYRSLTAIANAVTGTRWSGPRFFGLNNHG